MQDWSLFSDEDHLGPRKGSMLLMPALEQGIATFHSELVLEPEVDRDQLNQRLALSCEGI
jgi:hypothetical protein